MKLQKILLIIAVLAILYAAGTYAHPVISAEKHGSHIAISLIEAKKPMVHVHEGFCAQPKPKNIKKNVKKLKVDDILNCAAGKSSWTLERLKGRKAIQDMIMHKDLPGLLRLKRSVERRMMRKAIRKYLKI
ncbi:hypothetical protein KR038_003915 [Drosophila bunnanda]|nr:hypothetical protein KR038_003915 [Drosophila bunnanda]